MVTNQLNQLTVDRELPGSDLRVSSVAVRAYRIPTEPAAESDGTAVWDGTTLVLVEVEAGGYCGTGWTYAGRAAAALIAETLQAHVIGRDPLAVRSIWADMNAAIRNDARSGLASYAVAALDVALWDLRARLLGCALCDLIGRRRDGVPVYGSGGFTSYTETQLSAQLAGWANDGLRAVKMKVGRDHTADAHRVALARRSIGPNIELFVDGNGGYSVAEAIAFACGPYADNGVTWFEQPVDHEDVHGTRHVREHAPPGMEIASGEYITDTAAAARVANCVDVLQADATRCGGYTGLLTIDGYCDVTRKPLSTHCSPMVHLHAACGALRIRHMEWFADHVRIERMLFDGFIEPVDGIVSPDRTRPGHGLTFKHADAVRLAC